MQCTGAKNLLSALRVALLSGLALVEESDRVAFTLRTMHGVRSVGCVLSPQHFSVHAESIMREALDDFEGGIVVRGRLVSNPRYADNTIFICSSKDEMTDLGLIKDTCPWPN